MDDNRHACHNATNGMMAGGAGYLVMPLPTLVAVVAIGGSNTAGVILAVAPVGGIMASYPAIAHFGIGGYPVLAWCW